MCSNFLKMKIKFDPKNPLIYRLFITSGVLLLMLSVLNLGPYVLNRSSNFQSQEKVLGIKTENISEILRSAPATPEITIMEDEAATEEIATIISLEDEGLSKQSSFENFDFDNFKGLGLHTHKNDNQVLKIITGKGGTAFAARLLVETNQQTYNEEGGNARVLGIRTEKRETNFLIMGAILFSIIAILIIRRRYKRSNPLISVLLTISLLASMTGAYTAYGQGINTPLDFADQNVQVNIGDVITYKIQYFNPDPSKPVKDVKFNFQIPRDTIYKLNSASVEIDDNDPLTHNLDGKRVTDANDGDEAYFQNDRIIIEIGDVPPKTWGNAVIQVVAEEDKFALAKTIMEYDGTRERLRTIKNPILSVDADGDGVDDFSDCDPANLNSLFCDKFTGNDGIIIDDRADLLWTGEGVQAVESAYINTNRTTLNHNKYIRTKPGFANNGNDYIYFKVLIDHGSLKVLEDRDGEFGIAVHYDGIDKVTVESNNLKKIQKTYSDEVVVEVKNQPVLVHIFIKNDESKVIIEDANRTLSEVGPYKNDKFNTQKNLFLYLDGTDYTDATFDNVEITRQENSETLPYIRSGGGTYIANVTNTTSPETEPVAEENAEEIPEDKPACLVYEPRELIFTDVDQNDQYAFPIRVFKNLRLADSEEYIINGMGNRIEGEATFAPSALINRFEITRITLLANCIPIESDFSDDNLTEFTDVPFEDSLDEEQNYIRDVMYTGQKYNVISAYQDGTVKPFRHVSLEEALKIFINTSGAKPEDFYGITTYQDVDFNRWSYQLIAFAETYGILDGQSETLQPAIVISKDYALLLLYRTLYYSNNEGILDTIRQFGWY